MSKVIKEKNVQAVLTHYEDIELIKNTIAPNATPDELKMLVYLSKQYNLDPLKKEIFFIKYGGKTTILTSRDGYLKIANLHAQFDGIESDVVYQADILTKREDGSLLIQYGPEHLAFDKTKLAGAFCNVFRKDRSKATTVFVSLKDYYKKGAPIWEQYINAMILKVAEAMALKRAFSISGLVTREEIEGKESFDLEVDTDIAEEKMATDAQRRAIFLAASTKQISEDTLKELMVKHCNKKSTKELTKEEANSIIAQLTTIEPL